jgi:hypothetical protein
MVNLTCNHVMEERDSIIMEEQWWSFSMPYAFEVDAKGLELVVRHNSVLECRSGSWTVSGLEVCLHWIQTPFIDGSCL